MANSYAFVLSKNTYPDAWQANALGVHQGTAIVYAATNTLSSSTVLFADSRLTQPIYGNPDAWLGAQLLTDDTVKYAVLVNEEGDIDPVLNPTTTSTTTVAPTTTTTTSSGTTTTTTMGSIQISGVGNFSQIDSCSGIGTPLTLYYASNTMLAQGTALFTNASLTVPYSAGSFPSGNGTYIKMYFYAEDQVVTMSGNIIASYVPCSGVTTTTTTTTANPNLIKIGLDATGACNGWGTNIPIVGFDHPAGLCESSTVTFVNPPYDTYVGPNNPFYISVGSSVRAVNNPGPGQTTATFAGQCAAC